MKLARLHHVALICADYDRSKAFYTGVLRLKVVAETYRAARDSWKLDLALADGTPPQSSGDTTEEQDATVAAID